MEGMLRNIPFFFHEPVGEGGGFKTVQGECRRGWGEKREEGISRGKRTFPISRKEPPKPPIRRRCGLRGSRTCASEVSK